MAQQKGSTSKLLMAIESTYNTVVTAASRKPVVLPFISESLSATRPQNLSNTIRGRRDGNPEPYLGFRDVKGQISLALDLINSGRIFKMLLGAPTTTHSYTGADIKDGPTALTVSGGSGGYTLNNPQSSSAPLQVGDRIVFSTGASAWITDNDQGVIQNERAGGSAISNGTYTITAIIRNQSTSGTPTITIASGVGTTSVAQPNAQVGDLIIYANTAGTFQSAWIKSITSTSVFNLVDTQGFPLGSARDVSASPIDAIERPGLYTHTFTVSQTAALPSYTFEMQFGDISTDPGGVFRYTGCKANQVGINIGGDQELVLTCDIVGAGSSQPTLANRLNTESGVVSTASGFTPQFEQFDATISEGGSTSYGDPIQSANITISNNLDESGYTINGQGTRTQLPEGIMGVTYQVKALFNDGLIINKAVNDTETSLSVSFTRNDSQSLTISSARAKYARADPQVSSPAGVTIDLEAMAYNRIDDTLPAVVVTLVNQQAAYE